MLISEISHNDENSEHKQKNRCANPPKILANRCLLLFFGYQMTHLSYSLFQLPVLTVRKPQYWTKRQAAKAKDLTFSKQKLATRQKGRCPECGESLFNDEELQVHHLLARSQGGKDSYSNLALVHLLCHQHIHAVTQRAMSDCQHVNDRDLLAEEKLIHRPSRQEKSKESCCT